MTPCYYCDIRSVGNCKTCIHSDTYEEPTTLKELTDEEIHECWEMFMGTDDYTRIDIARAILRKAQEK